MMEGLAVKAGFPCGLCFARYDGLEVCFISFYPLPARTAACRCSRQRTLVPPRLWMPGATVLRTRRLDPELSLRPCHSRYTHGISTPTARLPAFALPTATTSGMPWSATACEPGSILRRALHPFSLCTCKLACQTANDVAGCPQRFVVSSPCSSLLRTTTPVPAFVLP